MKKIALTIAIILGITLGAMAQWTGSGTQDNPYRITSKEDLNTLATNVNKGTGYSGTYFLLTTNLTYTHDYAWNSLYASATENNFTAIGAYGNSFKGHFDGDGHTISGIRIYKSGTTDSDQLQGVFGFLSDGSVRNLTVADASITGYQQVGAIAGCNSGGTIEDCVVASNVGIYRVTNGANKHGGIVGANSNGNVRRCTSSATIKTNPKIANTISAICGGIIGYQSQSYATDHYVEDNVALNVVVQSGQSVGGAIIGYRTSNDNLSTLHLTNNYYRNCTINGTVNAIDVGLGDPAGDMDGARCVHALTLDTNITASGESVVIGNTSYYLSTTTISLEHTNHVGYHVSFSYNDGTVHQLEGNTFPMPAADATVSATLTPFTYTVHFDANNGEGSMEDMTFTYDQVQNLTANTFTREDCSFSGWNTHPNGGGTSFTDGQSVSNLTTQPNGIVNLYAQWVLNYWPGSGTEEDPYIIRNTAGLDLLASEVNNGNAFYDKYFLQTADLTYDGTTNNYTPVGNYSHPFEGHYNGGGFTISGIYVKISSVFGGPGLFTSVEYPGSVENVILANSTIIGSQGVGGIAGLLRGGSVSNCRVESDVTIGTTLGSEHQYHGGIVGYAGISSGSNPPITTIAGCTSAASVVCDQPQSTAYGGIVGGCLSTIVKDCLYTGDTVQAHSNKGAIAGNKINNSNTVAFTNNYYTKSGVPHGVNKKDINGARRGYTLTLQDENIVLVGEATPYSNSGLTAIGENVLKYGDTYYSGERQTVSFSYTVPEGYDFQSIAVTKDGTNPPEEVTITENSGIYSFVMPASDVTVSATIVETPEANVIYVHNQDDFNPLNVTCSDTLRFRLAEDVVTTLSNINVGNSNKVVIDLNGKTLQRTIQSGGGTDAGHIFKVIDNSSLVIIDSSTEGTGAITGGDANQGGAVYVDASSKLIIKGGTIESCHADYGGAIYNLGTLTIKGGTIQNCTATRGWGQGIIYNNGTLTINGGTIQNNTAFYGGAIYNVSGWTTTINGGVIQNNNAMENNGYYTDDGVGGGILNYGILSIYGGTIQGNSCDREGGGIWMTNEGGLFMKGNPVIRGNKLGSDANNVYVPNEHKVINVVGEFTEGACIGVTPQTSDERITYYYSGHNSGVDPADIFFSDNGYFIKLNDDEEVVMDPTISVFVFDSDGNWNDAAKWVNGAVPSSTDNIYVFAAATIPNEVVAQVENITIGTGGSLTITDGGQLISSSSLDVKFKKNIHKTTNWGAGDYTPDYWYFISVPVSNTNVEVTGLFTEGEGKDFDLYRLNNTTWENYEAHTQDFVLENGKGYLYASQDGTTIEFNGGTNLYTDTPIDLSEGFNLIGNPYTFNVYVNRPYYQLNEYGTAVELVTDNAAIMPGTGVVVEYENGSSVTFTKAPLSSQSSNGNLQIALAQKDTGRGTTGRGTTGREAIIDNAIITFNEGGQLGKFYFGEQDANIYIPQGGKDYAIVSVGNVGEIPVHFKAKKNGEYTLTVSSPLTSHFSSLTLIDNLTGTNIDLLQTPSYTFTAKTTDYASRFKLVFSAQQGGAEADDDFAFISNGEIIINGEGTLQIIDALGRELLRKDLSTLTSHLSPLTFTPGVYVLRLINGENVKTQKIVIR